MNFAENSFSRNLHTITFALVIMVIAYLFVHFLPILFLIGAVVYAFVKIKKYIKSKTSKMNENVNRSNEFTSEDGLDGDVIDVDYKDV